MGERGGEESWGERWGGERERERGGEERWGERRERRRRDGGGEKRERWREDKGTDQRGVRGEGVCACGGCKQKEPHTFSSS